MDLKECKDVKESNFLITHSIDSLITYPIAELVAPFFHNLDITPNMVTTINIFLRMYILYLLIQYDKSIILLLLILLSHFLDCLDGTIARKYNQMSSFGNLLDHYSDSIYLLLGSFIILYNTRNTVYFNYILIILFIIFYTTFECYAFHKCFLTDDQIHTKKCNILTNNILGLQIILFYYYYLA